MASRETVFYGAIINPVDLDTFQALPHGALAVSSAGEIAWLEENVESSGLQDVLAKHGWQDAEVVELASEEYLIPGFVDTHTHAPQVPNIGSGQQYELLEWLENVTFPMESRFSDPELARRVYEAVVPRYINSGTTTCCYYGSLHLESTKILADIVSKNGQRAFVGKCNMNRDCPKDYIEPSATASIQATEALIKHIHALPSQTSYDAHRSLVHPILTPRFAISCTDDLLQSLGQIASKDSHLRIQTHISENASEIKRTKELFPKQASYASVYDSFGLLRRGTILAHAVHLEKDELALIKNTGSGISHCPTSNFNLRSGLAPVGEMLDRGIPVGLGTDVSGGFSPSILTAIQHASVCSKALALQSPGSASNNGAVTSAITGKYAQKQLSVATLLYLATLGGARVCALEDRIGSFAPGKAFDALIVSTHSRCGNPALWGSDLTNALLGGIGGGKEEEDTLKSMLERFLFCGDDRNVRKVYVEGKIVGGAAA